PEDLVPAEDEAPIEAYIPEVAFAPTPLLPPSFLSPWTPPLLAIPLPIPSTSYIAKIPEADTPPQKRLLLTAPNPGCEKGRAAVRAEIEKMAPKRTTRSTQVLSIKPAPTATTTTVTKALLQALIDRGVAAAMAEAEVSSVRNGYDNNGSGPRLAQAVRECTYLDFLKCIAMKTLKKMMTEKYCPKGEIKKLKTEMWELKTKGTDVIGYSLCFQELALMCDRMFLEESDRVAKYIGGLPDTIHDSVKATKIKQCRRQLNLPLN
nr:reverse transcriptase domain-containing protein [Tanacetum cinerariifolium]